MPLRWWPVARNSPGSGEAPTSAPPSRVRAEVAPRARELRVAAATARTRARSQGWRARRRRSPPCGSRRAPSSSRRARGRRPGARRSRPRRRRSTARAGGRSSRSTICPRTGRTAGTAAGTPGTSDDQLPAASTVASARSSPSSSFTPAQRSRSTRRRSTVVPERTVARGLPREGGHERAQERRGDRPARRPGSAPRRGRLPASSGSTVRAPRPSSSSARSPRSFCQPTSCARSSRSASLVATRSTPGRPPSDVDPARLAQGARPGGPRVPRAHEERRVVRPARAARPARRGSPPPRSTPRPPARRARG